MKPEKLMVQGGSSLAPGAEDNTANGAVVVLEVETTLSPDRPDIPELDTVTTPTAGVVLASLWVKEDSIVVT